MGHIHKEYDFTVSAYIIYENKILLVHHKKIGKWLQPGGHIELDEDPIQALWREIEEETGLQKNDIELIDANPRPFKTSSLTKELPIPLDFNVHKINDEHKHIDISYLMYCSTDKIIHNADEAYDIGWFKDEDMRELLNKKQIFNDTFKIASYVLEKTQSKNIY